MSQRVAVIAALTAGLVVAGPASVALGTHHSKAATRRSLPSDAPAALYRAEPKLPTPHGWPGPNQAFSATSGTGRYARGGYFWTDYLYDDHGASTVSIGDPAVTAGSPSFGLYTYPSGPANNNGADIFRAAVLRRGHSTYWRVDWNTLVKAKVPIAEWAFDTDNKTSTGGSSWPAGAGVSSPGIDRALVMSSHGAQVIDPTSGKVLARRPVRSDRRSQSFVARIPNRVLHPRGTWRIRLAAGLANPSGKGFAAAADAVPGQTRIFNVTFRTRAQEKPVNNFWNDMSQTSSLDSGDVAKFSRILRWKALRQHRRTRVPVLHGWSDRWYVSRVTVGPGILTDPQTIEDNEANYLGRVQPYAVYVPKSYSPKHRSSLTFLLHSLTQNHNQYAATTPHFAQEACEKRHSICATTLGRGPDGFYYGTAQLDFWQVWHEVAAAYRLDPNRTILSGYSMGGIGTNQIAMAHPDLFARAITLAGAVGQVVSLANLRWVPMYLAGGAEDELVPINVERGEANYLDKLGQRYRWILYPAMDHVIYELADSFADAARYMGRAHRVRHPGAFTFMWVPHDATDAFPNDRQGLAGFRWTQQPKLGITTTGAYWLRHLHARDKKADRAKVKAFSGERPLARIHAHRTSNVKPNVSSLGPAQVQALSWRRGGRADRRPVIRLRLRNVRSLRVLPHGAGFHHGTAGRLKVHTDGPVAIRIGSRTIHVAKGTHVVPFQA
jgi:hypothetical protein